MRLLLNLNNVLLIKMFFKNQWHRESFGTSVGSPQVLKAKRGGKKKTGDKMVETHTSGE